MFCCDLSFFSSQFNTDTHKGKLKSFDDSGAGNFPSSQYREQKPQYSPLSITAEADFVKSTRKPSPTHIAISLTAPKPQESMSGAEQFIFIYFLIFGSCLDPIKISLLIFPM